MERWQWSFAGRGTVAAVVSAMHVEDPSISAGAMPAASVSPHGPRRHSLPHPAIERIPDLPLPNFRKPQIVDQVVITHQPAIDPGERCSTCFLDNRRYDFNQFLDTRHRIICPPTDPACERPDAAEQCGPAPVECAPATEEGRRAYAVDSLGAMPKMNDDALPPPTVSDFPGPIPLPGAMIDLWI